jgi:hypothetical protein
MTKRKGKLRRDEYIDANYVTGERKIKRRKQQNYQAPNSVQAVKSVFGMPNVKSVFGYPIESQEPQKQSRHQRHKKDVKEKDKSEKIHSKITVGVEEKITVR